MATAKSLRRIKEISFRGDLIKTYGDGVKKHKKAVMMDSLLLLPMITT